MFKTSRRGFMVGCSAAIAAMTGGLRFTAFGSAEQEPNQDILMVVFLRGGMDGLNVVMPLSGSDRAQYEAKRPNIAIPTSGLTPAIDLSNGFGLHPAARPLFDLYQAQKMAIIHAAGLNSDTRSHFDAMQYMELGTPGSKSSTSGWLARHLQSAGNLPAEIVMPVAAVGNLQPLSLAGSNESIGMTNPNDFDFTSYWRYGDWQRQALRKMYSNSGWLGEAAQQTLNAVDVIEYANPTAYTPENGAIYPQTGFGQNLQTVAQLIKMQLGLRVATVDLGGWDTHEYQGNSGQGYFSDQLGQLAKGLSAFFTDLSNSGGRDHTQRLTITVMSEFGRSFGQNASQGTDHGHGNVMLVLGGQINGGKMYGTWPGLANEQLYDKRDLAITTDYRRVLSELLIRRHSNANLGVIFPGYKEYQPLDIFKGSDLPPNYSVTPLPTNTPAQVVPTVPAANNGTPTPIATLPTNTGELSYKVYLPSARR